MNCTVGTCTGTAQVHEPLPLCGTCALHVIANYAATSLGSEPKARRPETRTTERNLRIKAMADYLNNLDAGHPISGAALGRRYGRTARWGQKLVAELKQP